MVFLTQNGKQLVEVVSVEIKSDENGFYLCGLTVKDSRVKLGTFDSEDKAKAVLHQLAGYAKAVPKL